MKVGNFGRLDPELKKQGIVGLGNGSKLDEIVWNEFNGDWEKLAYESELLIAEFQNKKVEEIIDEEAYEFPLGAERETIIRQRVNQSFFLIIFQHLNGHIILNFKLIYHVKAVHGFS